MVLPIQMYEMRPIYQIYNAKIILFTTDKHDYRVPISLQYRSTHI